MATTHAMQMQHAPTLQVLMTVNVEVNTLEMDAVAQVFI
jgi:hypothetical protein